jgi:hypothetical protein
VSFAISFGHSLGDFSTELGTPGVLILEDPTAAAPALVFGFNLRE